MFVAGRQGFVEEHRQIERARLPVAHPRHAHCEQGLHARSSRELIEVAAGALALVKCFEYAVIAQLEAEFMRCDFAQEIASFLQHLRLVLACVGQFDIVEQDVGGIRDQLLVAFFFQVCKALFDCCRR